MQNDWERLVSFVAAHARDRRRDILEDLSPLEAIVRNAGTGEYRLAPAAEVSKEAFAGAIRFLDDVGDVAFVSLRGAAAPLVGEARAAFWTAHAVEVSPDIRGILWPLVIPELRADLGEDGCRRLEDAVWKLVGERVWWSMQRGAWQGTGPGLLALVRATMMLLLLDRVAGALLGDGLRLERSRPLAEFVASAMPLGRRRGRPGEWTVITA